MRSRDNREKRENATATANFRMFISNFTKAAQSVDRRREAGLRASL